MLAPEILARAARAVEARETARQVSAAAQALLAAAASDLLAEGLTVRAAGELLGLSHSRVHQLVAAGVPC